MHVKVWHQAIPELKMPSFKKFLDTNNFGRAVWRSGYQLFIMEERLHKGTMLLVVWPRRMSAFSILF